MTIAGRLQPRSTIDEKDRVVDLMFLTGSERNIEEIASVLAG